MLTCIVDNVHMLAVLLWNVSIFEIQRELLYYNVTQVYGQSHSYTHIHTDNLHLQPQLYTHTHIPTHTCPHLLYEMLNIKTLLYITLLFILLYYNLY